MYDKKIASDEFTIPKSGYYAICILVYGSAQNFSYVYLNKIHIATQLLSNAYYQTTQGQPVACRVKLRKGDILIFNQTSLQNYFRVYDLDENND